MPPPGASKEALQVQPCGWEGGCCLLIDLSSRIHAQVHPGAAGSKQGSCLGLEWGLNVPRLPGSLFIYVPSNM